MPIDIISLMYRTVVRLIVLLTALPFHEFAHAWTANKLGDSYRQISGPADFEPFAASGSDGSNSDAGGRLRLGETCTR